MSWLRGLSIRTRITLGTVVVALILSVVAGALLELDVESIVRDTTVRLLAADSAPFEAAIRKNPTDPQLAVGEGQLVAIIRPNRVTVLSDLPDSLRDVYRQLRSFHEAPRSVNHDGRQFLVRNERVWTPQGTWHVIAARSLEPGNLVLSQLRLTLVVGVIVLFVIFGAASWILSGAALRPVARMRRQAQLLDLQDRLGGAALPVGPARDELAALALTLNGFLARNRKLVDRERQMILDASHELRTPLAILSAQLDEVSAAVRRGKDPQILVERTRSTTRRLSLLTTNLLELSQLEAGGGAATSTWARLSLETSAAIDRARILGQSRRVLVDFDVADVTADNEYSVADSSFGRLIDNLLANAITAAPDGSTVSLELRQDESALVLTVADQGRGMPEEFMAIALDRFTRPDGARQRDSGGSGLGLAIVAAIVSAAGGSTQLINGSPGFTFCVRLPAIGVGDLRD
ncbi:MAG TPA: ATP-binding protein [Galbitalea sp.]|jgi:signal transduction histidine kinase|nr:ATP-binding protein [Galbitalea sp.]